MEKVKLLSDNFPVIHTFVLSLNPQKSVLQGKSWEQVLVCWADRISLSLLHLMLCSFWNVKNKVRETAHPDPQPTSLSLLLCSNNLTNCCVSVPIPWPVHRADKETPSNVSLTMSLLLKLEHLTWFHNKSKIIVCASCGILCDLAPGSFSLSLSSTFLCSLHSICAGLCAFPQTPLILPLP